MLEAGLWGLVGGSSLLIGAAIGAAVHLPPKVIGLVLAFGAGTLVSAVAFELTEEAFALGGADTVALGLALGALAYYFGDRVVGGENRMSPMGEQGSEPSRSLLLGAVLDGIPESAVIGISVLEGGEVGVAVLAAVFLSNLPEALSASRGMRTAGHPVGQILLTWASVTAVCGLAAGLGYAAGDMASGETVGLVQAFAGGAVLTMLADVMFPEALDRGGKSAGLLTTLGFACAYLLSTL